MQPFQTTLIIGLGGIGSRTVEGIYRKFMAANPSESDIRNVSFLCLDTDEADVKKRKRTMGDDRVVKTSSDRSATVGDYIAEIKDKCGVEEWFDTKSNQVIGMSLNRGAAQLRMASRLAYMSAISEGKLAAIDNSIKGLLAVDPERRKGNDIKIHIISSLAGGTGAGSFLQVAYYVKKTMRDNHVDAPWITGYFILADVLCNDNSKGFSDAQKENCRSNTYACIKEQVAFSSSVDERGLRDIDFEYMLGQSNSKLPAMIPYDDCFMIDYTGSDGGNLRKSKRYEEQVSMFVYLNAFSPIGEEHRSKAINDIRQQIEKANRRYAAMGVSKLEYPVDDLFGYFAKRQVADSLSNTWLRIDKDYAQLKKEYNRKVAEGIAAEEPDRGKHFMDNVESIAKNGSGREGAEFRRIYNSTQVLDKDMMAKGPKSAKYLSEIKSYIEKEIEDSTKLSNDYDECRNSLEGFMDNDDEINERNAIRQREEAIDKYWKDVKNFLETIKRTTVKSCLLADKDESGYVKRDITSAGHCLNTYILEREHEMHPMAVRFILYDVRMRMTTRLSELKEVNDNLIKNINGYKDTFDDKDTPDVIEGPEDKVKRPEKFWKRVFQGKKILKENKEDYEQKSTKQYNDINNYAKSKLLEHTLGGLLAQIGLLIDESEQFFSRLPRTIEKLQEDSESLRKKHDSDDDPSTQYVLASAKIKQDIYDAVVVPQSTPYFPEELSATIYRSMYENVAKKCETTGPATTLKADPRAEMEARVKADGKLIESCVTRQGELLREQLRHYATMNVIEALKEEAQRECLTTDNDTVFEYMKKKFNAFRDRAEIWGANSLDNVRFINAWGMNPVCDPDYVADGIGEGELTDPALTKAQANELFGDTDVNANAKNAASRLASPFFAPNIIVRANAVRLLEIDKNFKAFSMHEADDYTIERKGTYYEAYKNVIDRVKTTKTYSPHLDKRWHLPIYMANIGSNVKDETKRLFRSLAFGLIMNRFRATNEGGTKYWKYADKSLRWIHDDQGQKIAVGDTLAGAANRLLENGLATNPDIVDNIMTAYADAWKKATDEWNDTERDENNELQKMMENSMVKTILTFTFKDFPFSGGESLNWFSLLKTNRGTLLHRMITDERFRLDHTMYDDLTDRLVLMFGANANCYSVCKAIFETIADKDIRDDAMLHLDNLKSQNRFEPK